MGGHLACPNKNGAGSSIRRRVLSRGFGLENAEHHPNHRLAARAHYMVGRMYIEAGEYEEGLGVLYRWIQERKGAADEGEVLYFGGLGFAKLGRCDDAIVYFRTIVKRKKYADHLQAKAAQQIATLEADEAGQCKQPASPKEPLSDPFW